jgi:hypothetical protein
MKTRIAIAVACALGMSAAVAQTVQRDNNTVGNATLTVAQASNTAPTQVAQASGSAGGASAGAATGGAAAGLGLGTTLVVVAAAVATIAVAADSGSTVTH